MALGNWLDDLGRIASGIGQGINQSTVPGTGLTAINPATGQPYLPGQYPMMVPESTIMGIPTTYVLIGGGIIAFLWWRKHNK